MAQNNWEADKMSVILNATVSLNFFMKRRFIHLFILVLDFLILGNCRLDVYIYDYLLKRNLQTTAKAFMAEGKVAADPVGKCIFYLFFLFWLFFKFS